MKRFKWLAVWAAATAALVITLKASAEPRLYWQPATLYGRVGDIVNATLYIDGLTGTDRAVSVFATLQDPTFLPTCNGIEFYEVTDVVPVTVPPGLTAGWNDLTSGDGVGEIACGPPGTPNHTEQGYSAYWVPWVYSIGATNGTPILRWYFGLMAEGTWTAEWHQVWPCSVQCFQVCEENTIHVYDQEYPIGTQRTWYGYHPDALNDCTENPDLLLGPDLRLVISPAIPPCQPPCEIDKPRRKPPAFSPAPGRQPKIVSAVERSTWGAIKRLYQE